MYQPRQTSCRSNISDELFTPFNSVKPEGTLRLTSLSPWAILSDVSSHVSNFREALVSCRRAWITTSCHPIFIHERSLSILHDDVPPSLAPQVYGVTSLVHEDEDIIYIRLSMSEASIHRYSIERGEQNKASEFNTRLL